MPGERVEWKEIWYPVQGIGDISIANEIAAINVEYTNSVLSVGLYTVIPVEGWLIIAKGDVEVSRQPVQVGPTMPMNSIISEVATVGQEAMTIRLEDTRGQLLLETSFVSPQ